MKLLFIAPSYKPAFVYGGPTVSISELAEALAEEGHQVTVYTTTANGSSELDVRPGHPYHINGVEVYYFRRITGDHTHVSPALWKMLWKQADNFDLVKLHSWWNILTIGAAWICRLKNRPFIISPHGMLGAYSFDARHSFIKKMIHKVAGRKLLQKSMLHATSPLEWRDCQLAVPGIKGFVLPNLVNLEEATLFPVLKKAGAVFTLGFLGRIDKKKGLELVLHALSQVTFPFHFYIAGSGDEQYEHSLKALAAQLKLDDRLEWVGWKKGSSKFEFLASIDLFVLTSYNENFAMAVAESLAVGTPVLVSKEVGLANYIRETELGWVCSLNEGSIVRHLNWIINSPEKLKEINEKAPAMIRKDFGRRHLAARYISAFHESLEPQLQLQNA